jgi:hypothetical protein
MAVNIHAAGRTHEYWVGRPPFVTAMDARGALLHRTWGVPVAASVAPRSRAPPPRMATRGRAAEPESAYLLSLART